MCRNSELTSAPYHAQCPPTPKKQLMERHGGVGDHELFVGQLHVCEGHWGDGEVLGGEAWQAEFT